jgi:hypothetical protein
MSTIDPPQRATFLPFALPHITQAEIDEVVDSLRSGWLTTGPKTKRFEQAFAEAVGAPHAVAVNSATAAMHLALDALGIGPGDEVIVPTYTFTATAEVVVYRQARPVLVDVDPVTCNMDPLRLEAALTPRTKAIIPVHIAGLPAEMDAILAIARAPYPGGRRCRPCFPGVVSWPDDRDAERYDGVQFLCHENPGDGRRRHVDHRRFRLCAAGADNGAAWHQS